LAFWWQKQSLSNHLSWLAYFYPENAGGVQKTPLKTGRQPPVMTGGQGAVFGVQKSDVF